MHGAVEGQLGERYSQRKGQGQFNIEICTATNDILRVNQPTVLTQLKNHNMSNKIYYPFGLNCSSLSTSIILN